MSKGQGRVKCPMCGKPAVAACRPFCSTRCKDLDLHQWLGGHYRLQTEERPDPGSGEDDVEG